MTYRCEAYVAKVALFGAEVWGWKGAGVEKAEEKALCVLLRAHARTKPGFLPLSVEAAKLAFGFLLSILRNRYSQELAALQHWKRAYQHCDVGILQDMVEHKVFWYGMQLGLLCGIDLFLTDAP